MSDAPLSDFCIYTIVEPKRLAKATGGGGTGTFKESKPWVTGEKLFLAARQANRRMPVLIGDATDCSRLVAWGILTEVNVAPEGTTYSVNRLRPFKRGRSPQELVLRSTGKTIVPGFIRPYAICRTPDFV